jgi:O-acetyl-ADP-ribose deacetylase (regulator of RNase III)
MSDEKKVNQSTIRLTQGDITDIEVEAFVFYARPGLKLGSGFGNAIAIRGGPTIQKTLDEMATPVEVGEAVVTEAGNLKAKYIIHAVGPVFQEENTEEKLRKTVESSLKRAEEKGIRQIAFPLMGAGFYGVPMDVSAMVTLGTVKDYLAKNTGIKEVVAVALDSREIKPFKTQFEALNSGG